MRYAVTITELLQRTVTVDADSPHQAEMMVWDDWCNEKYVLGESDFTGVDFTARVEE